jgi:hypothetical protein
MPGIYSLWIVGRNGGLLYSKVRLLECLSTPDLRPCGI